MSTSGCYFAAIMFGKYWVVIVIHSLSIIKNTNIVYCLNRRKLNLFLGKILPDFAIIFENNNLTLYCGSSSPVNWSFVQISGSDLESPVPGGHPVGYKNITLVNLQEEDSGYYYCRGYIDYLPFTERSFVIVVRTSSSGFVVPNWVEVREGTSVSLTCGSLKIAEWYSVNFYKQNTSIVGNTLTLHSLQKEHSGRYFCRGVRSTARTMGKKSMFHDFALILVESDIIRFPKIPRDYSTQEMNAL